MSSPTNAPPPLPSSIPSPHSRTPSTGFFHSVKRAVLGSSSGSDESEFIAARNDFQSLHTFLTNLRLHVVAFHKAVQSMHSSSHAVAKDYADIFQDIKRPHAFSHLLLTLCQGHSDLAEKASAGQYVNPVLESINTQFDLHKDLLTRIDQRQQLRTDYLYYHKKVDSLILDRTKRGRPEKAAETEHITRNQTKLQMAQQRYEDCHNDLLHDLQSCLDSRLSVYGPSMQLFIDAEKKILNDYSRAMDDVESKDDQSRLSLILPLSNGISIAAEHSPILDGRLNHSVDDHSISHNPFGSLDPSPIGGLTPTSAVKRKVVTTQMYDGDGPPPPFLYPYEKGGPSSPSAPLQSPPAASKSNPFALDEVEGVPNDHAVRDRMAGYSDPFVNGGGDAFFDYGGSHASHSALPVNPVVYPIASTPPPSSSSHTGPLVMLGSPVVEPPPEYHPVLYEARHEEGPGEVEPAAEAEVEAGDKEEVEEEAGEEETEEAEEEGIPAHLVEEAAAHEPPAPPAAQPPPPVPAPIIISPPIPVSAPPPLPPAIPSHGPPVPMSAPPPPVARRPTLSPTAAFSRPLPPAPAGPPVPVSSPAVSRPPVHSVPHPVMPVVVIPTPPPNAHPAANPFDDD